MILSIRIEEEYERAGVLKYPKEMMGREACSIFALSSKEGLVFGLRMCI